MIVNLDSGGKIIIDNDRTDVLKYKWRLNSNGYAIGQVDGKSTFLHRYLLKPHQSERIDHINRHPRDNRLSNLRIISPSENSLNTRVRVTSKTGVKGVFAKRNKFYSQITLQGKHIHLGTYNTIREAKEAYDKAFDARRIT